MDNQFQNLRREFENTVKRIGNKLSKSGDATGDLTFKLYTPKPTHPDWESIKARSAELAQKAAEVIECDTGAPREIFDETLRITDALSTVAQSAVKNYRRMKRGDHTLIPLFYIWTMHNYCNFRCSYCDNHFEQKYFELSNEGMLDTDQGKKLLAIMRKNTTGIYFCGGEPTMRKDLPELVEEAHRLRYFPLMINTNVSRIHEIILDPRYKRLLKNMDMFVLSLDALDMDVLTRVWGVKKSLCEQVLVNILALRRLQDKVRMKLVVNTVITPETVSEADSILDWTNDLGLWFSPVPMNCGPIASRTLTQNPEYKALCDKIVARKEQGYKVLGSRRFVSNLLYSRPIHCHPALKPHIDFDGCLIWPCKTLSRLKPVKVNVLEYDSLDEACHAAARIICPDNIHGTGPGQCGGDCNWSQNYVSDIYASALKNPLSTGMLSEVAEFLGAV